MAQLASSHRPSSIRVSNNSTHHHVSCAMCNQPKRYNIVARVTYYSIDASVSTIPKLRIVLL